MHILFALPGSHRFERGAEVAFESIAHEIARRGNHRVTVAGSGQPISGRAYTFERVPMVLRNHFERWPKLPFLRTEFAYEDLTFSANLLRRGTFGADLTVTCSFPYTSLALRRRIRGGNRPAHVFVTQNGDWPATGQIFESLLYDCDGLVCTNPIYFERNRARWRSALIANGLDPAAFQPGFSDRSALPTAGAGPLVLMVSALEPGKRVIEAMRAVAEVDGAQLLIAGDGPQRDEVDRLAAVILPGRFRRATFPRSVMPDLYRSADLFLHTKIEESFGNVYIEALSCGVPVVAHDDAVTQWIFDDRAMLVDTCSIAATADAIRAALLKRAGDRAAIDRATAAEWARSRYAWARISEQYEGFLEAVLAQHRRSGR